MHLAFIVCLNVGGFPYLCLIMLLLLVPDAWIARVPARRDPATPPARLADRRHRHARRAGGRAVRWPC